MDRRNSICLSPFLWLIKFVDKEVLNVLFPGQGILEPHSRQTGKGQRTRKLAYKGGTRA